MDERTDGRTDNGFKGVRYLCPEQPQGAPHIKLCDHLYRSTLSNGGAGEQDGAIEQVNC